jgi:hypothetical protein
MAEKTTTVDLLLEKVLLHAKVIGTISAIYDIPLEEIRELEKRIEQDRKIEQVIRTQAEKAAKKKLDKMIPRLSVV